VLSFRAADRAWRSVASPADSADGSDTLTVDAPRLESRQAVRSGIAVHAGRVAESRSTAGPGKGGGAHVRVTPSDPPPTLRPGTSRPRAHTGRKRYSGRD